MRERLEQICDYIDVQLIQGNILERRDIVEEFKLPHDYNDFVVNYLDIAEEHTARLQDLLESEKPSIFRILRNTAAGAFAGLGMPNDELSVPGAALVALAVTAYDEMKKAGIRLKTTFYATFIGGLAGGAICDEVSYAVALTAGLAAGAKAIYDSKEIRTKREKNITQAVKELQTEKDEQKERLFKRTLPNIL
jgi:hypothetical protein